MKRLHVFLEMVKAQASGSWIAAGRKRAPSSQTSIHIAMPLFKNHIYWKCKEDIV